MAHPTIVFVAIAVLLAGYVLSASSQADKPHIVFIIVDDWGWNDVSFHGSDQIPTPNIDALAYSGVILNQHYVQPLCTPSRASLMTGLYPMRVGMQGIPIVSGQPRGLPDGKILPQYMKDLGYATHAIGKWHLGFYEAEKTPTFRGFDSHFGYWNGIISYYEHVTGVQDSVTLPRGLYGHDMRRNMTPAWDVQGKYATHIFTEEAVDIIKGHDASQPLFMYLAHLGVHGGNEGNLVQAPLDTIRQFRYIQDPNRQTYAAMVHEVDRSVGEVVEALEANGMLNNSIIVLISDNGSPTYGDYQNWGSNYPFRGIKAGLWQGAVRGNALIWTSRIRETSRVCTKKMHISDWLPTLYYAAGGNLADLDSNMDGINQWDVLAYNSDAVRTEFLVDMNEETNGSAYIQGKWKLVKGSESTEYQGFYGDDGMQMYLNPVGAEMVWKSKAGVTLSKLIDTSAIDDDQIGKLRSEARVSCNDSRNSTCYPTTTDDICLFDLEADPCETVNVHESNLDVANEMLQKLAVLRQELVPRSGLTLELTESDPRLWGGNWAPWVTCRREDFNFCTATPSGYDPK